MAHDLFSTLTARLHRRPVATRHHLCSQRGQGLAEYGVIILVVAIALIAIVQVIGKTTASQLCSAGAGLDNTTICNNLLSKDAGTLEGSLGGWAANNGLTTPTQTQAAAYDGSHSLALTATNNGQLSAVQTGLVLTPGQTYIAKAAFRAASTPRSTFIQVDWNNAHGHDVSNAYVDSTSGWGFATFAFAPFSDQGSTPVTLEIDVNSVATGEVHYVDHIAIVPATPYNLLPAAQSSFEDGSTAGWCDNQGNLANSTAQAHGGSHSLSNRTANAGDSNLFCLSLVATQSGYQTFSTYIYAAPGTTFGNVYPNLEGWAVTPVGIVSTNTGGTTGSWVRISVSASFTAGAEGSLVIRYTGSYTAGNQLWLDDSQWEVGGITTALQAGYTP